MSLKQFLLSNRQIILDLSEKKTLELAALRPTSDELKKGLPIFYEQLIEVLFKEQAAVSVGDERKILNTSGVHGKELLRLGYTISHVVHAYGAICQAITEIATHTEEPVTALEFHNLNRCLDIAIAGAVTAFDSEKNTQTKARESEHLGALAHELRNALNRAVISSEMMAKGIVGAAGSTGKVLQFSLTEMQRLIERAISEIKFRVTSEIHPEVFSLMTMINQLLVTAEIEAGTKEQTLTIDIDTDISVNTDRFLLLAALGNLVQNAMKYSKPKSNIKITTRIKGDQCEIEVSDQCGGIPPKTFQEMFKPFTQFNADTSGLGLGLSIALKAIGHCGGKLAVQNIPGGCSFKITLPRHPPSSANASSP
jgi:signal transduction histidine kinase